MAGFVGGDVLYDPNDWCDASADGFVVPAGLYLVGTSGEFTNASTDDGDVWFAEITNSTGESAAWTVRGGDAITYSGTTSRDTQFQIQGLIYPTASATITLSITVKDSGGSATAGAQAFIDFWILGL